MTPDVFETLPEQPEQLHNLVNQATRQLRDFSRRLELILSQDHKHIPIRDTAFTQDFTLFCKQLRNDMDIKNQTWQQLRENIRKQFANKQSPSSLTVKSFTLRAKTLSRSCDDFITAYDQFNGLYKSYTLSKLPVWILTSCGDDLNYLTGKILFLCRDLAKHTVHTEGDAYGVE